MSGDSIVTALAALALLLWVALAGVFAPAIWRSYWHRERKHDPLRSFLFFVASLQIGFLIRRLAAPDDGSSLIGLYALSIMCALAGVLLLRSHADDT